MKSTLIGVGAAVIALGLAGCGDSAPASQPTGGANRDVAATATPATEPSPPSTAPTEAALAMPPSWMPADWDRNVYLGSGEPLDAAGIRRARQNVLNMTPLILWAVSHDTLVTEKFEPIWVWYTALRSCARGIQMSEDLAGEFGNRERGTAELAKARSDLKAWAATQPAELTLYFPARLGAWNQATGAFQLQQTGIVTPVKPKDVAYVEPYLDGGSVELWSDRTGQAINHFQASITRAQCASPDKTKVYRFERMSQWWVVFGDVDRGMGGLANYKARAMLPAITMTREQAAALAQRNPERKVVVAVTFAPVGSSFVKGIDQSAIRAKYRQVTVSDALDDAVLAAKTY